MSTLPRFSFLVFLPPLLTGCTMFQTTNTEQARTSTELVRVQREVSSLKDSVRSMQSSREDVYRKMDAIEARSASQSRQQSEELAALKAEIRALRAERDAMQAQLVKELSAKMAAAMKQYAVQTAPPQQSGRLHKVESGQTLSEIARAYGTTVSAIMKANNLRSADVLKVNQELFIPE